MTAVEKKPWGVGATLAWAVLATLVGQVAVVAVWILRFGEPGPDSLAVLEFYYGQEFALGSLVSQPLQIAVLAWVARPSVAEYLGLRPFRGRDFVVGAAAVIALDVALGILGQLTGQDAIEPFQIELFISARSLPWLVALSVAVVVIAPLSEEITFRGFLFRGWVGANPIPGIVVISLLWSALHYHYGWFGILQLFLGGLLLGWLRWRTGSTVLTIALHALTNLAATVETVVWVG